MSKTVVMYVTARVVFRVEDDEVSTNELFDNMDYSFETEAGIGADVVDTELVDYEVKAVV